MSFLFKRWLVRFLYHFYAVSVQCKKGLREGRREGCSLPPFRLYRIIGRMKKQPVISEKESYEECTFFGKNIPKWHLSAAKLKKSSKDRLDNVIFVQISKAQIFNQGYTSNAIHFFRKFKGTCQRGWNQKRAYDALCCDCSDVTSKLFNFLS